MKKLIEKWVAKDGRINPRVFLFVALVVYFIFGVHHLNKFISADEHFWLFNSEDDRIHVYWQAIADRDWKDTRINDKPGITLAYIPGLVSFFEKNPEAQLISDDGKVKVFNPEKTLELGMLYKLPVLIFSGLFVFYFFWILRKITESDWIALWSSILILLSPILLGMSQIVNPDSMSWLFSCASMLTFFAYLKEPGKKLGILTGLLFGLAMASKYAGIILIPFFFFMMVLLYLFEYDNLKKNNQDFSKIVFRNSLVYWGIIFGGLAVFAILMPALIVEPKFFYEGTIGFPGMESLFWLTMVCNLALVLDAYFFKSKILETVLSKLRFLRKVLPAVVYFILAATFIFVLVNWMSRNSIIDLSDISYDLKRKAEFSEIPYLHRFIMESVSLVFSLTPLVLLSLIFLWIKGIFGKIKNSLLALTLSSFIIIFYLAVIEQGLLLTIRYSIILYPLVMILVAIFISEFFAEKEGETEDKKDIPLMIFSWATAGFLVMLGLSRYFDSLTFAEQGLINITYRRVGEYLAGLAIILAVLAIGYLIFRLLSSPEVRGLKRIYVTAALIILSAYYLFAAKPYYFNYTNDFLPKKYIVTAAWGYGGYEAAQFLNQMSNAKELTVWADMYGFCEFFVGKCLHESKVDVNKYKIDYYFRTLRGSIAPNFPHPMEEQAVWELQIDGRPKNFVKLYKALDL